MTDHFEIGDLCTPEVCISGVYSNHYLNEKLDDFHPYDRIYPNMQYTRYIAEMAEEAGYSLKSAKVFCTDSISLEFMHLDEIKATGAELIEMETGTFYTLAELFDVPSIALLAVSDNSATGVPLLGRGEELAQKYINMMQELAEGDKTKTVYLPYEATNLLGSIGGIKDLFKAE